MKLCSLTLVTLMICSSQAYYNNAMLQAMAEETITEKYARHASTHAKLRQELIDLQLSSDTADGGLISQLMQTVRDEQAASGLNTDELDKFSAIY